MVTSRMHINAYIHDILYSELFAQRVNHAIYRRKLIVQIDQNSGEDNGALKVQYVVEIKHLNERTILSLRST